jgi:hypothetical protein
MKKPKKYECWSCKKLCIRKKISHFIGEFHIHAICLQCHDKFTYELSKLPLILNFEIKEKNKSST